MKPLQVLAFLLLLTSLRSAEADELKVLTHNVWYGFTQGKPERHQDFRDWVKAQTPDIVALQELNGYNEEKLKADAASWGHEYFVLLKTNGFPTGITSNKPITKITRQLDGFHHGLLKATTHGHPVYVIHLHPSNWKTRIQEINTIVKLTEKNAIILGDFNTFSKRDKPVYDSGQLVPFFSNRDKAMGEKNLKEGALDYEVISKIEFAGFVDIVDKLRKSFGGTFPTKLRAHENHGDHRRLDYIFVSKEMAKKCTSASVIDNQITQMLSDHLPLVATFRD
ncbi:MAG: endonuclease/exonuclease/phosphatase family protein [Akkermansiaceae bacterium]|nr:endonuclease/exonuclease/phosphatase family protein [Akkermansiaceae bacterium]